MAGSTTGDAASSTGLGPEPRRFAVEPVEVGHVLVPLDGSPFAERALPVAAWVASGTGAEVHLVKVVARIAGEESEAAIRYLDSAARSYHATTWDVVEGTDVGATLAETVDSSPGGLPCLATHGRGRSVPLGSVAVFLLEHGSWPVVLVGPEARIVTAADAPIVVAVDGTTRDDVLVPVALGWAARLRRPLAIVTVAEPAPPGYREASRVRRARGPAEPEHYVQSLVARAEEVGSRSRVMRSTTRSACGTAWSPSSTGPRRWSCWVPAIDRDWAGWCSAATRSASCTTRPCRPSSSRCRPTCDGDASRTDVESGRVVSGRVVSPGGWGSTSRAYASPDEGSPGPIAYTA